jgi:predicted HTH transcriptional regulator
MRRADRLERTDGVYRAVPGGPMPGPTRYVPHPGGTAHTEQRRMKVLAYVAEHPGCGPAEIRRALQEGSGTISYDLNALRAGGKIQREGATSSMRYWTTEARDALEAARG